MNLFNFKEPIELSEYTLIVPSVSVGNVPQLAVDLLITTLKFKNVATLWHPGIVASAGTDPFTNNKEVVCTACELYTNKDLKLAVIQLRSTVETKLLRKFIKDFTEAIVELKIKCLYVLGTGFDYELHNIMNKDVFHFATNKNVDIASEISKLTSSKVLQEDSNGKIVVSGAGFGIALYESAATKVNNTVLLVKYISEGDNIHDATGFLLKLLEFLKVNRESYGNIVYPASWREIYGAPPPLGIF